ncbi:hypothetical protein FHS07_002116 [Microbacterium proteolyticum]|uniref:Uncharacterized protein n=1 Tax=Microbacterium proteolyticum TaxID=1572644 RepID=A0A7W5CIR3_9MICO|nr:hypothetical protein [Microbacterium proteolyticum]MBB3158420.1 hypothetical protein [Microbacterium proteolyticum]
MVRAYRQLGHPDQAGRFAIALDEGAQHQELRAYSEMLRRLGADEKAARRLSVMPIELDLPKDVRRAIEEGPLTDQWRPWGAFVVAAWASVVVVGFTTLVITYGYTMAGAGDVSSIARWWTQATWWVLIAALSMTALWCATSARWRAALVWTGVTVVAGGCFGLASVALSR